MPACRDSVPPPEPVDPAAHRHARIAPPAQRLDASGWPRGAP
jgi:hypothetical protein